MHQQHLFTSGEGGYFRYRIPALVLGQKGTLLAFCEARRFTGEDADQVDLLLRRSTDGGAVFELQKVILSEEGWVCGNPAPVLDRDTGIIWLLFCKNRREDREDKICRGEAPRSVWLTSSADDGETWSEPREITASVKLPGWSWYSTGPCHGIQLRGGRMLITCDHALIHTDPDGPVSYFSHVIISDDHGKTWRIGGIAPEWTNESTAVETVDGRVCLNCRNAPGISPHFDGQPHARVSAWSEDGGTTFSLARYDPSLPEPVCQASLCRVTTQEEHGLNRVLFTNPAGWERKNLTARLSYDECETWPAAKTIHHGYAAYSDLCVTGDLTIFCLYERGNNAPYETLTLARFDLAWLEGSPQP